MTVVQSRPGRTLVRGIMVLEAVASALGPTGVTEVAANTGLDKGTASRLLAILRDLGYVRQRQSDRQYELGGRCLWLAQGYSDSHEQLTRIALPYMHALRDRTGETVHLAVREGWSVVSVAHEESNREVRVQSSIGARLPIHRTATGRAILALMSNSEREAILASVRSQLAARDESDDFAEISNDLAYARLRGWAAVDLHDDVMRIAAGVVNPDERPIAAITLSGPTYRMRDRVDELGADVAATAARVSASLAG